MGSNTNRLSGRSLLSQRPKLRWARRCASVQWLWQLSLLTENKSTYFKFPLPRNEIFLVESVWSFAATFLSFCLTLDDVCVHDSGLQVFAFFSRSDEARDVDFLWRKTNLFICQFVWKSFIRWDHSQKWWKDVFSFCQAEGNYDNFCYDSKAKNEGKNFLCLTLFERKNIISQKKD